MVVFGGGNEGIVDELHVFNTGESKLQWHFNCCQNGGLCCCSPLFRALEILDKMIC